MARIHTMRKERDVPIYEYVCRHCGHEFETLVRSGSAPECPRCRSTALDKKLSVFSTAKAGPAAADASQACASCPHGGPYPSCTPD